MVYVSFDEKYYSELFDGIVVGGSRFAISNDEAGFGAMVKNMEEAPMELGGGTLLQQMPSIVERAFELAKDKKFNHAKEPKKLRADFLASRKTTRMLLTKNSNNLIRLINSVGDDAAGEDKIEEIKEKILTVQRLLLTESAFTLLARKDMTGTDVKEDMQRRIPKVQHANQAIQEARDWLGRARDDSILRDLLEEELDQTEQLELSKLNASVVTTEDELEEKEKKFQAEGRLSPEPEKNPDKTWDFVTDDEEEIKQEDLEKAEKDLEKEKKALKYVKLEEMRLEIQKQQQELRLSNLLKRKKAEQFEEELSTMSGSPGGKTQDFQEGKKKISFRILETPEKTEDPRGAAGGKKTEGRILHSTPHPGANQGNESESDDSFKTARGSSIFMEKSLDEKFDSLLMNQHDLMKRALHTGVNEQLPKFDGNFGDWNCFWQQFISIVDKNERLGTILKYKRLLSALTGEAQRAVKHLEFSEETYEIAKETLKRRFGQRELVLMDVIRKVMNHPVVKENDWDGLRQFIDLATQMTHISKQEYRGIDKFHLYPTLLIEQKLSVTCLRAWEQENSRMKRHGEEMPEEQKLEWMLEWLNRYAEDMRKAQLKSNPSEKGATGSGARKNPRNPPGYGGIKTINNFLTVGDAIKSKTKGCLFCGSNKHTTDKCSREYIQKNLRECRKKIYEHELCYNCLQPGHQVKDCPGKSCGVDNCQGRHNALFHYETKRPTQGKGKKSHN